jgi:FKBP-type peptidyl-prolyl cis-trans isomerase
MLESADSFEAGRRDFLKTLFLVVLVIVLLLGIGGFAMTRSGSPKGMQQSIPAPDDVAAPPKDAKKTPSGLASKVLTAGKGEDHPKATSQVTVHYTGWTTDGKMFDSSVARGEPATFPLNQVIKGWTEGVQLMVVGEKRRFWIPAELAYGTNPPAGFPRGMLVFDIELLSIK